MTPPLKKKNLAILDLEFSEELNNRAVIPELVADLVSEAQSALHTILENKEWTLQHDVINDLVVWYETMIARLTNNLFIQRYSSFFLTRYPLWRPKAVLPSQLVEENNRDKLDDYIAWEQEQGVLEASGPYPELVRLIDLQRENWKDAVIELLERVRMHQAEITDLVAGESARLDSLKGITFGISDPHNSGRTAAILNYDAQKVVYKPRSLDGEYGWNALLQELADRGLDYALKTPKILRFENYGFMEFVANTPCATQDEVALCYERYGAITAIAHAIGTYDLHHENIIVSKDCPIVIDAEPLLRCVLSHSEQGEQRLSIDKSISLEDLESKESVSDMGMLPYSMLSQLNADGEPGETAEEYMVGALHPFGLEPVQGFVPGGKGSDNLQLTEVTMLASRFPNLPSINGIPQLPAEHLKHIEKGFANTHKFLRQIREDFLVSEAFHHTLKDLNLRLLVRPTMHYGLIFTRSISAQLLASKEKRKAKILEDLRLLAKLRLDSLETIEQVELQELLDGDIPRLEVISTGSEAYNTPLLFSPITLGEERYRRMDELDSELQLITIREQIKDNAKTVSISQNRTLQPTDQLQHGFEVIESIVGAAFSQGGESTWAFTAYAPGIASTMVHADKESLYEGAIGTAVAIAEAGRLSGNEQWLSTAKRVFQPVLRGDTPHCIGRGGGIARGLGGLIYSLIRVADAACDHELLACASRLAIEHHQAVIEKEQLDEVLHGRAGFLLALTALYKRLPSASLEEIMAKIASQLVRESVRREQGQCWRVMDGHSLPNMSHGTSGISMALARWFEVSGDQKARELIINAIDYDNSFWDETEQGWVDARVANNPHEDRTTWTWCNGRSGALLSRLAISSAIDLPFSDNAYVLSALQASKTDILTETSPGLCCGTPGVLDSLIKVQQLCPNENIQSCIDTATDLITLKSPKAHYSNLTPALFTGTAGLAFALLRAAKPTEVPSMLWFG